ncbi:MAG: hypothetical protein HFF08_10435 [Oscillospiraceae bacterium]|nr:hypothetical protein [Oscillospiraceae bacterium]
MSARRDTAPTAAVFVASIPCEDFLPCDFQMLERIIAQNAPVIKKAFGIDTPTVLLKEGRLWFPWFPLRGIPGETVLYTDFACRLCHMAQWWYIPPGARYVRTGKLGMHHFLMDLGFYGWGQRKGRKLLLRNF